jgi:hypothetical protein
MSGTQLLQPVGVVEEYFGAGAIPVIAQSFIPGRGWQPASDPCRVDRALLARLAADGVTAVALGHQGRVADFRTSELLQARRPVARGVR